MTQLEKQENKLLNRKSNPLMVSTVTPILDKLEGKIPDKLKKILNTAFYKGFQFIFEKGSPYIEKTYNKDKIQTEYDINNYAVNLKINKHHMKRLDQQSTQSQLINSSLSIAEGGILGFLGIGLPDIPLFLSVIIKTVYEVALSYGFHYETNEEKAYILLLICGAASKDSDRKEFDTEVEKLGDKMDQGTPSEVALEEQMKITADVLSDALLTAKFIQGIPIVGAVGGIVNYNILSRISSYARIKYKKRYLIRISKTKMS